jgi:hypothetical protein
MPLVPGSERVVGLGLWRSEGLAFALEAALVVGCALAYRNRARSPGRRAAATRLMVALVAVEAFTAFAPVPPPGSPVALVVLMLISIAVFATAAAAVEGRVGKRRDTGGVDAP